MFRSFSNRRIRPEDESIHFKAKHQPNGEDTLEPANATTASFAKNSPELPTPQDSVFSYDGPNDMNQRKRLNKIGGAFGRGLEQAYTQPNINGQPTSQGSRLAQNQQIAPQTLQQPILPANNIDPSRYDPALAGAVTASNEARASFFGEGGTGRKIGGYLGDFLLQNSGFQPFYRAGEAAKTQHQAGLAQEQREDDRWQYRFDQGNIASQEAERLKAEQEANAVQTFMSGRDRLQYDPVTGLTTSIYDAPTTAEEHARSLGLTPEDEGYKNAILDFVLKGHGPTAFGYDRKLDDYRTNNDIRVKGTPTYRQRNPAPPRRRSAPAPRPTQPKAASTGGRKWNGRGFE